MGLRSFKRFKFSIACPLNKMKWKIKNGYKKSDTIKQEEVFSKEEFNCKTSYNDI